MAVTLEQLAEFVQISDSDVLYPQLQGVFDAAAEYVAARAGDAGETTLKVRPRGRSLILPRVGLTSVDSVTDPASVEVDLSTCDVDEDAGIVILPRVAGPGAYTVVVTSPESARRDEATLIIGRHLWEARRAGRGAAVGAYATEPDLVPVGFAIPRRAEELLQGIEAPGFA